MSVAEVFDNIVAWSLQIGLLVGLGALVPVALKLRMPRARLVVWQVLFFACLTLPWMRPWRQEVVNGTIQVTTAFTTVPSAPLPAELSAPVRSVPFREIALWLLAAGVMIRLALLGVGLARMAAYRRRGREIPSDPLIAGARAAFLLSDDVSSPVTFGWLKPVVLLPARFPSLGAHIREAILRHELMHVKRRDWLFMITEELVRAVLWFHPAIWWVIGEIQLAREQTVDQAVMETTLAREPYVDALLLMAGVPISESGSEGQMDLAPAPMFLRRRHLKRRLREAMQEVRMAAISKTRLVWTMGAAMAMVAAACWLATGAFPLSAAPQVVADSPGVSVNMNGARLMHRSPVPYPADALAKGVEGAVVVQVRLNAAGEVVVAEVLSGPDELRKAAQQSVLTWHFDKSVASTTQVVNIDFSKAAAESATPNNTQAAPQVRQIQRKTGRGAAGVVNLAPPPPPPPPPPTSGKLSRIEVTGLSDSARAELLSRLPIREGGEWSPQMFDAVSEAAKEFDPHLVTVLLQTGSGEVGLAIGLELGPVPTFRTASGLGGAGGAASPGQATVTTRTTYGVTGPAADAPGTVPSGVYRVGNGVTPPKVVFKSDPVFPDEPGADQLAGPVILSCVIGTDGKAEEIHVVKSIDTAFDSNAIDAVSKWAFQPGMLNGVPVQVRASIEINFRKP